MCVTHYAVATTEKNATIVMPAQQDCDIGPPENRVDCAYPGGGKSVCDQRVCCWNSSILGTIWCFYGNDIITRQTNTYINLILYTCRQDLHLLATVIFY